MGTRHRVDRLLVDRGLAPSRARAQALVMAGKVVVDGHRGDKASTMVALDAVIVVKGPDHPYVSRGGLKLAGALDAFARREEEPRLDVAGRLAMDIGASTGGFTDCLLQRGVARVHAVDVGYGQLAWKLSQDERVLVHDRQNIRKLETEVVGEVVDLVVVDCSFIALAKVLPHVPRFLADVADVVALVKPQFELDPTRVGKGGIVRNAEDRADALAAVEAAASEHGFTVVDRCPSPITGRDGNVETLVWLHWAAGGMGAAPP
jgi:23S rRNA (cytidine1920-2'-O)/16S rRNA (cytidine1409-2'-O)-methyltransferase